MEIEKRLSFGMAAVDWEERINMQRMRDERLAKARAAMQANNVDAVLVAGENLRYATGLRTSADHFALVFADDRETYLFLRHEHGAQVKRHCPWINPDNILGKPIIEPVGGRGAYMDSVEVAGQQILEGLTRSKIGKGRVASQINADVNKYLAEHGVDIVPLGTILDEARECKTVDEVNCLRMVGSLIDAAWCRMIDAVRPGVTDCEVAAAGREFLIGKGSWNFNISLRTGPNCYPNWGLMTDRMMQPGDLGYGYIMGDLYMGYRSCHHRTWCVAQEPTQRQKDWYAQCLEWQCAMQDALKPGNTTADVAEAMPKCDQLNLGLQHEYEVGSNFICHGVGLGAHDFPNINRFWSIKNPIPIKVGQCVAVHSCFGEPGVGGVRIENVGVVTENGWENFSTMPYDGIIVTPYQIRTAK